jgi:hypothetical protein
MALVRDNGPDEYNASFGNVDRSAFVLGRNGSATVINQGGNSAAGPDVAGEVISKIDELIRGVEKHWEAFADPGQIHQDLRAVRAGLRDREPDKTTITKKLKLAMTGLAPVTALTELAASIAELISRLH